MLDKKKLCGFFTNHKEVKESTEQAGSRERFVRSCRCGERVTKSVPLHDNDFLADINLSKNNFPVDKEASTQPSFS